MQLRRAASSPEQRLSPSQKAREGSSHVVHMVAYPHHGTAQPGAGFPGYGVPRVPQADASGPSPLRPVTNKVNQGGNVWAASPKQATQHVHEYGENAAALDYSTGTHC